MIFSPIKLYNTICRCAKGKLIPIIGPVGVHTNMEMSKLAGCRISQKYRFDFNMYREMILDVSEGIDWDEEATCRMVVAKSFSRAMYGEVKAKLYNILEMIEYGSKEECIELINKLIERIDDDIQH